MNKMVETYVGKEEKMVMAKDMLFATLDTTVRKITQNDKKDFLLSDTVGFISKLPHGLVKAFRSTWMRSGMRICCLRWWMLLMSITGSTCR